MKPDGLYQVKKEDAEKLITVLSECFCKDPLYCNLIPEKEVRARALPEIFSCDVNEFLETCDVYADSPEINGIMIVSDETEPYNPLKYYATEAYYQIKTDSFLIKEDPSLHTLWNFIRGKDYLNEEWTNDLNQDKRLHIVYFAVRPQMQGHGIASKMMDAVLKYADKHQLLTSLETHNEKNVAMYRHYGFELFEIVQKHFELKQYCMVRKVPKQAECGQTTKTEPEHYLPFQAGLKSLKQQKA